MADCIYLLSPLLIRKQQLKSLDLSDNRIGIDTTGRTTDEGIEYLASALCRNQSVLVLKYVPHNNI